MKAKKTGLKISLYTKFMVALAFILIILVGCILFVIQKREVKSILQDARDRGVLIANTLAFLNREKLTFWDYNGVKKNIEEPIDKNLLYVVFFDKFRNLFVASEEVKDRDEITCCSRLPETISEGSVFIAPRDFKWDSRTKPVIEIEVPIFAAGTSDYWGSVKIGLSLESMQADIRQTRLVLILIGCGGLLVGMIGSALLAKRVTGPLKKLVDGTVRISRGDFTQDIKVGSKDEIGNLAQSFNEMTHDLLETRKRIEEANKRLIQAEKLASIGRIAATIAHEIRNPLTSVKLNIQRVSQNEQLDEVEKEHLSISQEGISQIEKFIKELLNFTRVSDLLQERFTVEQILEEAVKMMKDVFQEKKIVLEKRYARNLPPVLVDGDKIRQVFLNIMHNAYEAVDTGGTIRLDSSLVQQDGARRIRITISDDGCGIPEKDWENIFEPFFTTKASGFGLGLANARKIIEQHKGSIRVVKKEGKGTSFEVQIPSEGEA